MSATESLDLEPPPTGPVRGVSWGDEGLVIDERPSPLVSGTLEYWRVNSLYWRRCLAEIRKAGLRQVSSFVCWDFHLLEDGTFDFTGRTHSSRDLAGFIDLCAEEGLDFLLRLGPIIDAEWPTRGPAPDVCDRERIDPVFRARTEEFFAAVLEHAVPRLATRGGPIVLVNLDNEPYFPYATDADSDSSEGVAQVDYQGPLVLARYAEWLRERYPDDDALRRAWNDPRASRDAPREPDYRNSSRREILDSFEFITAVLSENFAWMRDTCARLGVDVPMYSNSKQFTHYLDWATIEQVVDSNGLGMWFDDMLPGEQPLLASWYVRLQRAVTRFPWAGEMQAKAARSVDEVAGIPSDPHYRYLTELAVALGLRGLCYYPLVERDDALFTPISATGKLRPRLTQMKEAIAVTAEAGYGGQLHSVGLLWSLDHHRLGVAENCDEWQHLHRIWIELDSPKELPGWWRAFKQLQEADADFALVTEASDSPPPVLVYAGPEWVRTRSWERVVEWVEDGAGLVVATSLPSEDIDGSPEAIAALNERLRASGRLREAAGEELLAAIGEAATLHWCRSDVEDVWSFAYREDDRYCFFLANVGAEQRHARLALEESLAAVLAGGAARDLVGEERWTIGGGSLSPTPILLEPKSVRAIEVVPAAAR